MKEIESAKQFLEILPEKKYRIFNIAIHNIDLRPLKIEVLHTKFYDCIFLGCEMDEEIFQHIRAGNLLIPDLKVPYNTHPSHLYTRQSLYKNFNPDDPDSFHDTPDQITYRHYLKTGKEPQTIYESMARRMHDHSISDALYDFLENYEEKKIVAVMGGHGMLRTDKSYKKVARLSKELTEKGYLLCSGGGPGAMEATHLGAWMAARDSQELEKAFGILSKAPSYKDTSWLSSAFEVLDSFPAKHSFHSLGVPTWLYGHEPATPFATQIAKYFANSVREDGLLVIAKGGVIYTPGSAGTIQEIFQDATQNHYKSYGYASPMLFLDQRYWTNEKPVYPLLKKMSEENKYKNLLLSIHDEVEDIVKELKKDF